MVTSLRQAIGVALLRLALRVLGSRHSFVLFDHPEFNDPDLASQFVGDAWLLDSLPDGASIHLSEAARDRLDVILLNREWQRRHSP